jgi:hypothetical protein
VDGGSRTKRSCPSIWIGTLDKINGRKKRYERLYLAELVQTKRAMSRMWYLNKDSWTAEETTGREFQIDAPFEEAKANEPPAELTLEESLAQRKVNCERGLDSYFN